MITLNINLTVPVMIAWPCHNNGHFLSSSSPISGACPQQSHASLLCHPVRHPELEDSPNCYYWPEWTKHCAAYHVNLAGNNFRGLASTSINGGFLILVHCFA